MYCTKCGAKVSDDAVFCTACGCKLQATDTLSVKMVHLKCQDCGGELDVDASKQVLSCPYCHSKQVIIDSDEVKIASIKSEENKELAKIKSKDDTNGMIGCIVIITIALFFAFIMNYTFLW